MQNSTKTKVFRLSIISSLLFILAITFGQKFWSDFWLLYGFVVFILIVFYIIVLIQSLLFWINNREKYNNSFIPFLINTACLILVIALPLNYMRNRTGFVLFRNDYESAVEIINKTDIDPTKSVMDLPSGFKYLSVGGGQVSLSHKQSDKAILFYTFRGTPDGFSGFLKIPNNITLEEYKSVTGRDIFEVINLGDNWYFVSGD